MTARRVNDCSVRPRAALSQGRWSDGTLTELWLVSGLSFGEGSARRRHSRSERVDDLGVQADLHVVAPSVVGRLNLLVVQLDARPQAGHSGYRSSSSLTGTWRGRSMGLLRGTLAVPSSVVRQVAREDPLAQ